MLIKTFRSEYITISKKVRDNYRVNTQLRECVSAQLLCVELLVELGGWLLGR